MTRQEFIEKIYEVVPPWEKVARIYRAFEGDWRVVVIDEKGREKRYFVSFEGENITLTARV